MVVLFSVAAFLSAALVFMVQPMVAKAMLPTFGGTPQVWTVSMLFFQGALLVGYGYAHLLTQRLTAGRQALVHVAVLLLPLITLPIALRGTGVASSLTPALAVLAILAFSVGLPYVVVAATSPLVQRWFSATGHPHSHDPYFLYAAGNAGSLLGLLLYPFLIEPNLRLADQGLLWSIGYIAFVAACGVCAYVLARRRTAGEVAAAHVASRVTDDADAPPTMRRRISWVVKAFIPSSLLLGVTTHVQTDVAAVPLLWVIPLALYLLTFVIAFSPRRPFGPRAAGRLLPFAVVLILLSFLRVLPVPSWGNIAIHDAGFFLAAMLAHGLLADDRPSPRHLTSFYLLLAVGGVLGGLFNAIAAPFIFDQVLEYPAMLTVALLLRTGSSNARGRPARREFLLDLVVGAIYLLILVAGLVVLRLDDPAVWVAIVGLATLVVVRRPTRFAAAVGLVLALTFLSSGAGLFADRTFFGVNRVADDGEGRRVLLSGATVHGAQRIDDVAGTRPLAYYHHSGPAGQVLDYLNRESMVHDVAVIGLGAGSLAAYSGPGQTYTFFEIDPVVIEIANDPDLFTFLRGAGGQINVIEGDGRLRMASVPASSLDLVVLDAFSSDAIPAHIVTGEAFASYLQALRPSGLILANVSNAYLDVQSVVVGAARANGLLGFARTDTNLAGIPEGDKEISSWVVLSRDPGAIAFLADEPGWVTLDTLGTGRLWTDDFSDILSVIR